MTAEISHPYYEDVGVRNTLSLSALVWLAWESLVTMNHEYQYIWKGSNTVIKWLYLFVRYLALTGQIANHIVSSVLLSQAPLKPEQCRVWFAFQALVVQGLITSVEAILMIRVYALYGRSAIAGVFLFSVFVFELGVMTYTGWRVNVELRFDGTCLVEHTPKVVVFMGAVAVTVQIIVWSMTLYKQAFAIRDESTSPPLIRLVTRDGAVVCILLTAFFGVTVPYTYWVHELTHSVFSILITLLSIIGCRLIMNMQRLDTPELSLDPELTTCVETSIGSISDCDYDHEGNEPLTN